MRAEMQSVPKKTNTIMINKDKGYVNSTTATTYCAAINSLPRSWELSSVNAEHSTGGNKALKIESVVQ